MNEDPRRAADQLTPAALPDFSEGSGDDLPDYETQQRPVDLGRPSEEARGRSRTLMLTVIGGAVVLLAVLALVLSQTVFRSVLEDPEPEAFETGPRSAEGQQEYVPDPEDPDLAPPPPIFTQAPTTRCTMPARSVSPPPSPPGVVRGGELQYEVPATWGAGFFGGDLPYLTAVGAEARQVEGNWYSVVNVGEVVWPEDEDGGYPGLEGAAVAIFQCYATTTGVKSYFGENPEITDYRTEPMTVDGHPAWIVQATYHFEDQEQLETTSSSVVTSIVVEGPNGPSALASDVAADQPDHVQELEEIISSLEVVA